jgi:ADP-ribosylglycohydrolase
MNKNNILGMLVGGAIGDALGMPVESWSAEKITEKHPDGINGYKSPKDHKWFDGTTPAGSITDDTQLTIATMRGLIQGHKEALLLNDFSPYMDAIAQVHCEAIEQSDAGWGNTTREAVRRLQNSCHWAFSGKTHKKERGTGNGVPMKISPLGAWAAAPANANFGEEGWNFSQACVEFSAMTHYTQMSAYASIIHAHVIHYCLWSKPETFSIRDFANLVAKECWSWKHDPRHSYTVEYLNKTEDSIQNRMELLDKYRTELSSMSAEQIREHFGDGSCYVYTSLPFSYAYFLRDPYSVVPIIEVIEAGGDTDTNAKIVGEMLGALHGIDLFCLPENYWMLEGLRNFAELVDLADDFCDVMEIPDG